jgi:hypothetical protein
MGIVTREGDSQVHFISLEVYVEGCGLQAIQLEAQFVQHYLPHVASTHLKLAEQFFGKNRSLALLTQGNLGQYARSAVRSVDPRGWSRSHIKQFGALREDKAIDAMVREAVDAQWEEMAKKETDRVDMKRIADDFQLLREKMVMPTSSSSS